MLRWFEDGLAMHQLRYPDEIKPWSEVPIGKLPKSAPAELGLAQRVIEQLRHETFDPTQYQDEVKERVREMILKKVKGGKVVAPAEAPKPVTTDLMDALKASLAGEGRGAPPLEHRGRDNGHARANGRSKRHDRGHRP